MQILSKTESTLNLRNLVSVVGPSLFSSGDEGVGCSTDKFAPHWPTSSPYVTSVGGTNIDQDTEIAWSGGGGRFSTMFAIPDYQKDAVQK